MRCTVAVAVVTKGLLIQNRSAPQPSSMTTADVQGDSAGDDALYAHEGEQGEFGYSSIPSNHNSGSGSTASQKDVFGIVLSFGRIQPIWQLNSLVCYRGMWQDDRERNSTRRDVVLTVATDDAAIAPLVLTTYATGCDDYISKPILMDTLANVLRKAAARKRRAKLSTPEQEGDDKLA